MLGSNCNKRVANYLTYAGFSNNSKHSTMVHYTDVTEPYHRQTTLCKCSRCCYRTFALHGGNTDEHYGGFYFRRNTDLNVNVSKGSNETLTLLCARFLRCTDLFKTLLYEIIR